MTKISLLPGRAVIAAVLPALALAACNKPATQTTDNASVANSVAPLAALPATLPLTNDTAATPLASAPAATALPAAPPPRIVRIADPRQSYAYADRAAAMSGAVDAAPPDYAFDYGGVQPWAWRAGDGSTEVVEPVGGGYRYYYYEPGASRPYLVRDPDYAYGYDDGDLAAVYGPDGRYLPPEDYRGRYADQAGRYLVRGAALIAAAAAVAHYGVSAGHWRSHRAELSAERARWQEDQQRQVDWRAYHDEHAASEHDHWQSEQAARDDRAARFDQWQRTDFRGPPPSARANQDRSAPPSDDGQRRAEDDQRQRQDQLAREQQARDQQQQRQIADQRTAADRQAQADRLQRDNDQRRAEADRADRRQETERDNDARQQVQIGREQAAAERQQAAEQRQQVADQRQRVAVDRQAGTDRRQPDGAQAAFARGDRDRQQGGSFDRRDDEARARAMRADDPARPASPPAQFAPGGAGPGSARPAHVEQQRHDEDAASVAPRPQTVPQPKPESGHGEPRQEHAAAIAHAPPVDLRASAHIQAGQDHGKDHDHHGH